MRAHLGTYDGHTPRLGEDVFLAPGACVVGQADLGDRVSVWYGAVVRADVHWIRIGEETNVQDCAVLHGLLDTWPVEIGRRCSIGHNATVHGCVLGDEVLVGIGARVLDGARVGDQSLIAAGTVVREGSVIPPRSLVAGVPGVVKRTLSERELALVQATPDRYLDYARKTRAALESTS